MDNSKKILASLICLLMVQSASAEFIDVGIHVDPSRIDDPDFMPGAMGSKIKVLYDQHAELRSASLGVLPTDFDPVIDMIYNHIQATAEQKNVKSQFYVGLNGELNGLGFNFDRENLPTKIAKLSFCFGFDPLVFTGVIEQESHYSRTAESTTGATGFTQLTAVAIAEVSEQLGLLGNGYHGEGAPEIFGQYIQCYLGSNEKWVNIWEQGIVPEGKNAYARGFIGSGRKWAYETAAKKWLNENPDRNLIYGAILFKLYLGHYGGYAKALAQYNVSHKSIYAGKVNRIVGKIQRRGVNYSGVSLSTENSDCFLEESDWAESLNFARVLEGLYPEEEVAQILEQEWLKKGFCKSRQIHL